MILFEKFTVYIEELDMELEQKLHIAAGSGSSQHPDTKESYVVQKFIVDESAGSLELYARMTTVFRMGAFHQLPTRIEALALLSGKRYVWEPNVSFWRESLDNMRLAKSLLLSPTPACPKGHAAC